MRDAHHFFLRSPLLAGLAVFNTSDDARLAQIALRLDSRYAVTQNPLTLGQGCAVFFVAALDQPYHG